MKKKYLVMLLVMLMAVVMTVSGCGNSADGDPVDGDEDASVSDDGFPNPQIRSLNLGAGGTGGSWYLMCAQLSEDLKVSMPDTNVSVVEGGAISNVRLTNQGIDLDVGTAALPDVLQALAQEGSFADDNVDNVKVMLNFAEDYVQFTVKAKSGIDSIADLSDKIVLPGPNGWGIEALTRDVLGLYDLDYDTIQANGGNVSFVSWGEAPSLMKDGHADMAAFKGTYPNAIIMEIEATNEARVLGIEEGKLEEFLANSPGYSKGVIPAGTYKGQKEDASTISHTSVMFANGDISDDVVYVLTKTVYENREKFNTIEGVEIMDNPLDGIDVELMHPGAVRYFEDIGIL